MSSNLRARVSERKARERQEEIERLNNERCPVSGIVRHLEYNFQYWNRMWRWGCLDCGLHGFVIDSPRNTTLVTRQARAHECDLENVAYFTQKYGRQN